MNSNCGSTTARLNSSKVKPTARSFSATACETFSASTSLESRSSSVMACACSAPSGLRRARWTRQLAR